MVSNDKPTLYKYFSFVGKVSFPLTALENFYLPLSFQSLTIICLGVDFFVYILFAFTYFLNSVRLYLFSNSESFTLFLQAPLQAQSLSLLLWFQWYIHVRVFNIIPQVSEALSIIFMLFSLFVLLFNFQFLLLYLQFVDIFFWPFILLLCSFTEHSIWVIILFSFIISVWFFLSSLSLIFCILTDTFLF